MDIYPLIRPLLFRLPPETAHRVTFNLLHLGKAMRLMRRSQQADQQPVQLMGLDFPNRVGLAAGLDKNAEHIEALTQLDFGFIEVGTITPKPQPGNPKPRMFRIPEQQALINRMGFNNHGLAQALENIAAQSTSVPLGINIGKNFFTPNEQAVDDYLTGLTQVWQLADYISINISSPNTKGLRDLQGGDAFSTLLSRLAKKRDQLADQHQNYKPLVVKIAPDLDIDAINLLAEQLQTHGIDGVIATNTTIDHSKVESHPHGNEQGGVSGLPVQAQSTEVIRHLRAALGPDFPIIGVGGIDSLSAAEEKRAAGADLVQVYTGLIYQGPALIRQLAAELT